MKEKSNIYGMQRANGDWFAFDNHGHLRMPVFHDARTALMSRQRNFEMLLFSPVQLNALILNEVMGVNGGNKIDFVIINDASVRLNRGTPIQFAQLISLVGSSHEYKAVPKNENGFSHSEIPLTPVAIESGYGKNPLKSKSEAEEVNKVQAIAVH